MRIQSKELTQFYREYKAWLDAGAPIGEPFQRYTGLCDALEGSLWYDVILMGLLDELKLQFSDEGLDELYPFGKENFISRVELETQHLDPLRIKWVEDHLKPEFTGEK